MCVGKEYAIVLIPLIHCCDFDLLMTVISSICYPNSFTALDAISIAVFVSALGPESQLAMAIRPNGCRPFFTEPSGPPTV